MLIVATWKYVLFVYEQFFSKKSHVLTIHFHSVTCQMLNLKQYCFVLDQTSTGCHNGVEMKLNDERDYFEIYSVRIM